MICLLYFINPIDTSCQFINMTNYISENKSLKITTPPTKRFISFSYDFNFITPLFKFKEISKTSNLGGVGSISIKIFPFKRMPISFGPTFKWSLLGYKEDLNEPPNFNIPALTHSGINMVFFHLLTSVSPLEGRIQPFIDLESGACLVSSSKTVTTIVNKDTRNEITNSYSNWSLSYSLIIGCLIGLMMDDNPEALLNIAFEYRGGKSAKFYDLSGLGTNILTSDIHLLAFKLGLTLTIKK